MPRALRKQPRGRQPLLKGIAMTEPTQDSAAPLNESEIARHLVFTAGYGIMEVVEDLQNHFGGRSWRPPADTSTMVAEIDRMIAPLDHALLHARELIIRSENPGDPDMESLEDQA